MKSEEFDRFIESWGSMGILWGINRSIARVHAFIILSEDPVDLDKVASYLNISRGNASMCLKELRNWGIIQRIHLSGDRRDFYVAEPDIWKMLFRIAVERKKREFDPALHSLRHLISEADIEQSEKVYKRLTQMEETFTDVNRIMTKFLEDESKSKTLLNFIKSFTPK
jgi:DNA-binding transcriptional regulator GbsR (MarR family)